MIFVSSTPVKYLCGPFERTPSLHSFESNAKEWSYGSRSAQRKESPYSVTMLSCSAYSIFNPNLIFNDPSLVDHVLMGFSKSQSQEIDAKVVDDVRNFMFLGPDGVGIDLAALNIQRGRDHGLPDYNTVRASYVLAPVHRFADITSDTALQATLQLLYGTVDNIDVWVGSLAEDHLPGASVGSW
jgi:hypothetical protein